MSLPVIHIWKKAPFLRLLAPLMAGIILQWHLQLQIKLLFTLLIISFVVITIFFFIPFFDRFKLSAINGFAVTALFISIGGLLSWYKNIQHNDWWFGKNYSDKGALIVTLLEDPVEKTKSLKANASVDYLFRNDSVVKTSGSIILYFKRDSPVMNLSYGSRLVITKPLQEIRNSGNPGGFDYRRYSVFQGITHQVYLKGNEFELLQKKNKTWLNEFMFASRSKVLNILRTNIKGEKELGLAEALLIGYKGDLDKTLVQSYSNTGVVHVIAISGLHLGLIYWLLNMLFRPLRKRKRLQWLNPVLIITGLWVFSLLAGAQPSVIRSAVMFTCIVLGQSIKRNPSIYNTLAFSAFLLLCYNPFWLWDVGFQLSYAAVLSIVIFMQPVYSRLYFPNKIVDFLWKLTAVTIAAQVLTTPISIYHFHQFPIYFILTNFLAVPVSSLIVLGEILLCTISFIPSVALVIGKILYWLIWIMNSYIERIELLPFSLWEGLQISVSQAVLLLITTAGICHWLMEKKKMSFKVGLAALLGFVIFRSISFINANNRQQLIVYNVPRKTALDLIDGRNYFFIGDTDLLVDDFTRNFHIKPSRFLKRSEPADKPKNFQQRENLIIYKDKRILFINDSYRFLALEEKVSIDLLLISGNPKLYFKNLAKTFSVRQVVFDGSCPTWKINYWKKDCDSLNIPNHDVSEKGAFVMNLR